MNKLLGLFLLGLLCLSAGCKRVRGDGDLTSEKRELADFKGVHLSGSMDVELNIGEKYAVTVDADRNLLQYIRTKIEGDQLWIGTEDRVSLRSTRSIVVHVTAPVYNQISLSGSGNIVMKGHVDAGDKVMLEVSGSGNLEADLKAENLTTRISGSGAITLKGNAKYLHSSITGSGDLHAGDFEAEEADFEIAGSGDARVRVTGSLTAHIAGSGDVSYYGNPKVNSSIAGSGSVRRVD